MAARPLRLASSILLALSVACAKSEPPKTEAAAPPELPPGTRSRFHGFAVGP